MEQPFQNFHACLHGASLACDNSRLDISAHIARLLANGGGQANGGWGIFFLKYAAKVRPGIPPKPAIYT